MVKNSACIHFANTKIQNLQGVSNLSIRPFLRGEGGGLHAKESVMNGDEEGGKGSVRPFKKGLILRL